MLAVLSVRPMVIFSVAERRRPFASTKLYYLMTEAQDVTRNSSGDEIAIVNFLRRDRTRTTAHNKVHFAYGKHTCL